jgi:hypothetical protein
MTKKEELEFSELLYTAVLEAYREVLVEKANAHRAYQRRMEHHFGKTWSWSPAKKRKFLRVSLKRYVEYLRSKNIESPDQFEMVALSISGLWKTLPKNTFETAAQKEGFRHGFREVLRYCIAKQAGEEYGRAV